MKMKARTCKGAITLPRGFTAAALSAGIKKAGCLDLMLLYSEVKARAAAVFTTNAVKAWPVIIDQEHLKAPYHHAVFVNSGNANCFNGRQNDQKARRACKAFAKELGLSPNMVFTSSTGVIGRDFPIEKVLDTIPQLVKDLSRKNGHRAAEAILTTDTRTKEATVSFMAGGRKVTLSAIGKGAGMLHPNMATMLVYLTTDLNITKALLHSALKEVTQKTFNRISVDNDMSTNDTVLILANGMSTNALIRKKDKDYQRFYAALEALCFYVAKELVRDGEGVTRLCDITVVGAKNEKQAECAARAIADSMLFKTALHGADPNWGRIVAALGACSGLRCAFDAITICFDHVAVMRCGKPCLQNIKSAGRRMQKKEVFLTVDLGVGKAEAHILTSDLSKKYIEINADYTT